MLHHHLTPICQSMSSRKCCWPLTQRRTPCYRAPSMYLRSLSCPVLRKSVLSSSEAGHGAKSMRNCIQDLSLRLSFALLTSIAIAQQPAKLVFEKAGPPPDSLLLQYKSVVTHTHNWRFSDGEPRSSFEDAEKNLVAWCARLGISAVGVG